MIIPEILDERMKELDITVFFCRNCMNSNQRPGLTFDERKFCDACQFAEVKDTKIDWKEREKELEELCDRHRSKDSSFDVIVPSSGGKDSCYVAHQLKYTYDMHPLTVTWTPSMHTEVGWQNFQNFVNQFDAIVAFPKRHIHGKLSNLGFQLLGDPFIPWHMGQRAFPYQLAVKFGIPLVFYGENTRAEYGGGKDLWFKSGETMDDLVKHMLNATSTVDVLVDYGLKYGLITEEEARLHTFDLYRLPDYDLVKETGLEIR